MFGTVCSVVHNLPKREEEGKETLLVRISFSLPYLALSILRHTCANHDTDHVSNKPCPHIVLEYMIFGDFDRMADNQPEMYGDLTDTSTSWKDLEIVYLMKF